MSHGCINLHWRRLSYCKRSWKQELVARRAWNGARYSRYNKGPSVALVQAKRGEKLIRYFRGEDVNFRMFVSCHTFISGN